jgi:AraC-like DNA-binding protein
VSDRTVRAAVPTGYVETARTVGLDPLRMLDAVGIPRAALEDLDLRIPTTAVRDLLELSARAADDFALQMADRRTPSVMGPLALIAREQATVRGVLEAISRLRFLHNDATDVPLEDIGDLTIIHVVSTWPTPGPERQTVELAMAQIARTLRLFLGSAWRPLSTAFVHAQPKVLDRHRRIFGPNVEFNQAYNGMLCHRSDLDRKNPAADPEMARHIERYIAGLGGSAQPGLVDQLRELVLRQLPSGGLTAEVAARKLGLDLRTMQRQLAAADTSFGHIVQETRLALIPRYLVESDRPLSEVAELLGFSALSAFSRWHRTHYGVSASAHRAAGSGRGARRGQGRPRR